MMAATTTVQLGAGERIQVQAEPLTTSGFAPFGSVVADPQPGLDAGAAANKARHGLLPPNAVSANQGSAVQYRDVSCVSNLYHQAPSGRGEARMSVFVCAARGGADGDAAATLPIRFLERHPFTTQTFSPLRSSASTYLVVVAPSLPPSSADPPGLPVPGGADNRPRHGGLPDLRGLRAFVATDAQAVTYGAGTWHAPMVVLGEPGAALAFVVTQFASGVAVEDCQLVEYVARGPGDGVEVRVGVGRRPGVRPRL